MKSATSPAANPMIDRLKPRDDAPHAIRIAPIRTAPGHLCGICDSHMSPANTHEFGVRGAGAKV